MGQGVGQRGRGRRLAETTATRGLPGFAEEVGGGADDRLDRSEQEDEQGLRELCASGESFVYAAMIRLMTRRLTRL